ncbi:hypothetical protein BW14_07160 [Bifidobacterium sp. UTBIF-68]|uniref:hypothetical protein n=1 Tax=Bifidobacterium sp. UTBIF-68 TaxID=1465262 RepID=UPI001128012D|nr:hypothetical protein [Bifidobacterium sp. UTBIF-68]TPF92932.1 hypothetical protein BW14_07160 [Bifidobacterium sp. UTBIF-68]
MCNNPTGHNIATYTIKIKPNVAKLKLFLDDVAKLADHYWPDAVEDNPDLEQHETLGNAKTELLTALTESLGQSMDYTKRLQAQVAVLSQELQELKSSSRES